MKSTTPKTTSLPTICTICCAACLFGAVLAFVGGALVPGAGAAILGLLLYGLGQLAERIAATAHFAERICQALEKQSIETTPPPPLQSHNDRDAATKAMRDALNS